MAIDKKKKLKSQLKKSEEKLLKMVSRGEKKKKILSKVNDIQELAEDIERAKKNAAKSKKEDKKTSKKKEVKAVKKKPKKELKQKAKKKSNESVLQPTDSIDVKRSDSGNDSAGTQDKVLLSVDMNAREAIQKMNSIDDLKSLDIFIAGEERKTVLARYHSRHKTLSAI